MHLPRLVLLLPLFAVVACDGSASVDGPFALAFDGQEDCVEIDAGGVTPPSSWTVELWFRGEPTNDERPRPLLEWKGLFSLGAPVGGGAALSVGTEEGISLGTKLMDGVLHHVAGTFDGQKVSLFLDGTLLAFADGTPEPAPAATLRVGCDANAQGYAGLLDEVRLSSALRYDGDFDRPVEPFVADADTVLLFHFDEGEGEQSFDDASGVVAGVYGPEWVPFDVSEGK